MSWLTRYLPSRAAILAVLATVFAGFIAWSRRDARRTLKKDLEHKEIKHAQDIDARVDRDRADPERLRPYRDAGWRD